MSRILWNKKYTETLAVTLERFRLENPDYQQAKITYAGRLDPMAEGLLILLTDEDVHKKDELLGLDKIYEVEFILGVSTDTYDILGCITDQNDTLIVGEKEVEQTVKNLINITELAYPKYSSKTVDGVPLWKLARAQSDIQLPIKKVQIYSAKYLSHQKKYHEHTIIDAVNNVTGDFRQSEIIRGWKTYFSEFKNTTSYTMRIHASSGTYMRSLVHIIGETLGIGATTIKITRIAIGDDVLT